MSKSNIERAGFGMLRMNRDPVQSTREIMIDTGDSDYLDLNIYDLVVNDNNPYPVNEIDELVESIKVYGLQQNLVVKDQGNGKYVIYAGHKRYTAMMKILEDNPNNEYVHLETVKCLVLSRSENEIVSHIRKHETNTLTRSLLKMSDEEKMRAVEDFMHWINLARDEGIEINGKPIKGKTRDLVAERFGISESSAKRIMQNIKQKDEGGQMTP
ncbi:ParB N-terminal domain-containing protein [Erysipelothrix sp. HDW6C]|uniref:ParB/RepB/Spo0J family partition protein n=1 Tax=Erysipelothrix sp. HDW6C TaxID=2714930 RepID=UPI0014097DAA|nr:ParB/Srx family N-terminal domain-containing protein [Erysipelothrix sp. HDW6C]QIK70719.1 ParB N-terminal domain-containing protein [Erysipelothrix sp. HDW6C]